MWWIQILNKSWKFLRLKVFRGNSPYCSCFVTNISYNLRNLNLITLETKVFLRLEVIRRNSSLCRFFMLWSPTFWGINISCGSKTDTIKILSCLYHDLDDFEMKDKSFNLPHFVGFIMYDILQSEESKITLNTNSSSDCRNQEKIPHFVSF